MVCYLKALQQDIHASDARKVYAIDGFAESSADNRQIRQREQDNLPHIILLL